MLRLVSREVWYCFCRRGGFNIVALSYAVWNETTGYLTGSALVRGFERRKWLRGKWMVENWGVVRGRELCGFCGAFGCACCGDGGV